PEAHARSPTTPLAPTPSLRARGQPGAHSRAPSPLVSSSEAPREGGGTQSPSAGTTGTNSQKDAVLHAPFSPVTRPSGASYKRPARRPWEVLDPAPPSRSRRGQEASEVLGAATNFALQPVAERATPARLPMHTSRQLAERAARPADATGRPGSR
ncbi:hypothetical protein H1C71_041075, partial [Ictidomys tridecemlineatus]